MGSHVMARKLNFKNKTSSHRITNAAGRGKTVPKDLQGTSTTGVKTIEIRVKG